MQLLKQPWFWVVMLSLVALGCVTGMVFSGHLKGTEAVAFIGTGLVSGVAGRLTAPKGGESK